MTAEVGGLVWLRMSFAWSLLVSGMEEGWQMPDSEARRRGTLHGLIFREWYENGEEWMGHFVRSAKTDRDGQFSN